MQQRTVEAGFRLQRMTECMAEVEERAGSGRLAFIGADDPRLRPDRPRDRMAARQRIAEQQRGAVRFAPREEIGVVDQAVFHHLGIAGANLARGSVSSVVGSISTSAGW